MKKLAAILTVAGLLTGTTRAANLLAGNRELGVAGTIDFDTVDDTLIDLNVTYGYFIADYFELGARVGLTDSDTTSQWRIGGFTEYHLYYDSPLVPFFGGSIDLAGASIDIPGRSVVVAAVDPDGMGGADAAGTQVQVGKVDEDNTAIVLGLVAGVKYFLNEDVAISSALNLEFATDDIFPADNDVDSTNWDIEFGLRFFF
jgi:hypothetical protein